jgi:hypothetical protein
MLSEPKKQTHSEKHSLFLGVLMESINFFDRAHCSKET